MSKLADLYGSKARNNPELTGILFSTAFPVDTTDEAKAMRTKSDETFTPFITKWKGRLETAFRAQIEAGMVPQAIVANVPWLTKDEYTELLDLIDGYIVGEGEAFFALRLMDLNYYALTLQETAMHLLHQALAEYQSKRRIMTPFDNNANLSKGGLILPG